MTESKGEFIMCRVIAIANNKGGVGKTTTCASLAYGLVNKNKNVLIIDADPLGSLTRMFGINKMNVRKMCIL